MPKPIKKAAQVAKDNPMTDAQVNEKLKEQCDKIITLGSDGNMKVEVVETILKFDKKSLEDINLESKTINPDKVAEEVLQWLDVNVENYIDNHAKVFEIPIDNLDVQVSEDQSLDMSETIKLQNLYRSIPDDDDFISLGGGDIDERLEAYEAGMTEDEKSKLDSIVDCRGNLDNITQEAFRLMNEKKELKDKLAKRMMFFYEMIGFQNGKPIIQEQKGVVNVLSFDYDSFSMGVRIRESKVGANSDRQSEKNVVKEYIIPEGFNCCIEISCVANSRPTAMF